MPELGDLHFNLLAATVFMFVVGGGIAYVFQRFKLPTFLAFIITGILMGPSGLNLVDIRQVQLLAQVGIIFLLFIVGLDLSVDKLKQLRYQAPLAGVLQLAFSTLLVTAVLYYIAKLPLQLAFLLGSIVALSSTTIVLKSMEEHRELDTDYGRLILGILIIQDLSIVPLMALLPTMTKPFDADVAGILGIVLLKAIAFAAVAVVISLRVVPVFLDRLASTNQKELFTLALVTIGLGMALLTEKMGLSYEAGAFIAGLALSGSIYCHQIIADSKGFRDVFLILFFVMMGLLFNVDFLLHEFGAVMLATVTLIALKGLGAFASAFFLRFPQRTSLWCAVALFQVGEFSFILLGRVLEKVDAVPAWAEPMRFWSPVLVDAILISMFLTPLAIRYLPSLIFKTSPERGHDHLAADSIKERVIIAGYGPTAQNLADALLEKDVPFVVVEMNVSTVKRLNDRGIPALYGDISKGEILKSAGIESSRILALTFPDVRTSEVAYQQAKALNPNLLTLVRSRYRADIPRLYDLGVDVVIHEEFETSVSFIFNIMTRLDYPIVDTERLIALVRDKERAAFGENIGQDQPVFGRFSLLEGTKIEWLEISARSPMLGKSLAESRIRQQTGVNVIAVIKPGEGGDRSQVEPSPDLILAEHDVLVAVGSLEQLHKLEAMASGETDSL